jgi:hypothetical protein
LGLERIPRSNGKPLTSHLETGEILAAFRRDPMRPKRIPFAAAKKRALVEQVLGLLKRERAGGGLTRPLGHPAAAAGRRRS